MPSHIENVDKSADENNQVIQYENSYELESKVPFDANGVKKIIQMVLNNNLSQVSYDSEQCPKLCEQIAAEIQRRVQKLKFHRYKILVGMTIVEKASQSMISVIGLLWNSAKDDCATYTYETMTFVASCYVFGFYYE